MSKLPRKKILIILHQETSTPGRLGWMFETRGYKLDIRRPRFGQKLPETMQEHAGAVIFGGPMSANDKDAFIKRETDWISIPLKEQKPFLGLCLGAQMLARNLGAEVKARKDNRVEIGYYDIHPTQVGKTRFSWPQKAYQWHSEGFDLPRNTELLARGDLFPNQAFLYGPKAFGIQFHPEVSLQMMHRWTVKASARLQLPGAKARQDHFSGNYLFDPQVKNWLNQFLDVWIGANRQS